MTKTIESLHNSLHQTERPKAAARIATPERDESGSHAWNTLLTASTRELELRRRRVERSKGAPAETIASWRIGSFLGAGATAVVYEATHTKTGQRVALKILEGEHRERFEREIAAHQKLGVHDRVVGLLDYGTERLGGWRDVHWLAYELVSGGTLRDLLRSHGRVEPELAHAIVRNIAEGLEALHDHGLIHRDLKPENILLDEGGARLTDLGLIGSEQRIDMQSLTVAGAFVGTVAYASPEQIEGQKARRAADLWALGVIAFELLSGKSPFARGNPFATAVAVSKRQIALGVAPRSWRSLLERLLSTAPSDRGTAASAVLALDMLRAEVEKRGAGGTESELVIDGDLVLFVGGMMFLAMVGVLTVLAFAS